MRFDLQAHRGGMALTSENTLPAFEKALRLGVSTLEFDIQITKDGHAVVAHDRDPTPDTCRDTGPAFPGDPEFPYVDPDTNIFDLTLAQVRTIDCGSKRHQDFPRQELVPGARIPLLTEVLDLVAAWPDDQVGVNMELKVEVESPGVTASAERFVRVVLDDVRDSGLEDRVLIESFDWEALMLAREFEPRVPVSALTNGRRFLQPGRRGASPWLGGIDIDDYEGSLQRRFVDAAGSFDADVLSPVHGEPHAGSVDHADYEAFTTPELVDAAHEAGMLVVPWTVDDAPTLRWLIDIGVDGVITNRPDMAREVMAECGLPLPSLGAELVRR